MNIKASPTWTKQLTQTYYNKCIDYAKPLNSQVLHASHTKITNKHMKDECEIHPGLHRITKQSQETRVYRI